MVFLRLLMLLFAGYPLYQDEQERFVCNTIQPGCANVCYDLFSPVSVFRFWLVQLTVLCIPYFIFVVYVVHKVSDSLSLEPSSFGHVRAVPLFKIQHPTSVNRTRFMGAYVLQLMFRTLLEAGFGAAHYYLFGFYVPKRFLCQHPPCTTQVDCYISRPTEKTAMLNFMLGVAALSLLLDVLDFVCAINRSVRQKKKNKKTRAEKRYEEECCSHLGEDALKGTETSVAQQDGQGGAGRTASFRKRRGSGGGGEAGGRGGGLSSTQEQPCLVRSVSHSSEPLGCNTNGNNGYSLTLEEAPERSSSEAALCPPEPMGTPRSIRVNKRSRLKPPPPPRRDLGSTTGLSGDVPTTATCTRKAGQYTLVELGGGKESHNNDDGQEKKSEWV